MSVNFTLPQVNETLVTIAGDIAYTDLTNREQAITKVKMIKREARTTKGHFLGGPYSTS